MKTTARRSRYGFAAVPHGQDNTSIPNNLSKRPGLGNISQPEGRFIMIGREAFICASHPIFNP